MIPPSSKSCSGIFRWKPAGVFPRNQVSHGSLRGSASSSQGGQRGAAAFHRQICEGGLGTGGLVLSSVAAGWRDAFSSFRFLLATCPVSKTPPPKKKKQGCCRVDVGHGRGAGVISREATRYPFGWTCSSKEDLKASTSGLVGGNKFADNGFLASSAQSGTHDYESSSDAWTRSHCQAWFRRAAAFEQMRDYRNALLDLEEVGRARRRTRPFFNRGTNACDVLAGCHSTLVSSDLCKRLATVSEGIKPKGKSMLGHCQRWFTGNLPQCCGCFC